jgi:2-polyprenyl-3-methyl-5-hydroxy-6-metoxy-1,4-benzoquinol methylase
VTSGDRAPGEPVSARWSQWRATTNLDEYYSRWRRLEDAGHSPHGEADLIESFHPRSVLDAGCGMGRVAIELSRRGVDVVGVDLDDDLLVFARQSQSSIHWVHADLATMQLERHFDVVAMPGNVMVYCRPSDRQSIIRTAAEHLQPSGLLIAGFDVERRQDGVSIVEYDEMCASCNLGLAERWATWHRDPYHGGSYAVSVHQLRNLSEA